MTRVWYFAYGSNMQSATLRDRRGVGFTRAVPARLDGWRLVLDKPPILPGSGTFANIVPDADAHVLGVAFEITIEEMDAIELGEGVRIGNYRRIDVTAEALSAAGGRLSVVSLSSDQHEPDGRPTDIYMDMLIAGALEHGLPAEWVATLRAIRTAPETAASREHRLVLDAALRAARPGRRDA